MTRLRKMMLEELQRRNFSEDTIRHYIHRVEDFARHFNRPLDRLGLRHIREYQAHLFQKRKLSSGSVTNHLAALRFFYIQTLKKAWSVAETPYPKKEPSPSRDPQPGSVVEYFQRHGRARTAP
jgi:integrase/recombinase XerD